MTVRPEFTEYIRTLVRGDHETNDRIQAKLDAEGWNGFPRLLAAIFFLAVDRRFPEAVSRADVITFVAELRADLSAGGPDLDAEAAEILIGSIANPDVDYSIDQGMIARIQAATVYKVLVEEDLSDSALDAVLAKAAELAGGD